MGSSKFNRGFSFDSGGIVLTPPRLRTNGFDSPYLTREPLMGVGREMAAMSNQHITYRLLELMPD
jgi:hypothetical protein